MLSGQNEGVKQDININNNQKNNIKLKKLNREEFFEKVQAYKNTTKNPSIEELCQFLNCYKSTLYRKLTDYGIKGSEILSISKGEYDDREDVIIEKNKKIENYTLGEIYKLAHEISKKITIHSLANKLKVDKSILKYCLDMYSITIDDFKLEPNKFNERIAQLQLTNDTFLRLESKNKFGEKLCLISYKNFFDAIQQSTSLTEAADKLGLLRNDFQKISSNYVDYFEIKLISLDELNQLVPDINQSIAEPMIINLRTYTLKKLRNILSAKEKQLIFDESFIKDAKKYLANMEYLDSNNSWQPLKIDLILSLTDTEIENNTRKISREIAQSSLNDSLNPDPSQNKQSVQIPDQDGSYQQLQVNSLNNHFPKVNLNSDPTQNKQPSQISDQDVFYPQSLVNFWSNRFPNFDLNLLPSQNKQHEGIANTTTTTITSNQKDDDKELLFKQVQEYKKTTQNPSMKGLNQFLGYHPFALQRQLSKFGIKGIEILSISKEEYDSRNNPTQKLLLIRHTKKIDNYTLGTIYKLAQEIPKKITSNSLAKKLQVDRITLKTRLEMYSLSIEDFKLEPNEFNERIQKLNLTNDTHLKLVFKGMNYEKKLCLISYQKFFDAIQQSTSLTEAAGKLCLLRPDLQKISSNYIDYFEMKLISLDELNQLVPDINQSIAEPMIINLRTYTLKKLRNILSANEKQLIILDDLFIKNAKKYLANMEYLDSNNSWQPLKIDLLSSLTDTEIENNTRKISREIAKSSSNDSLNPHPSKNKQPVPIPNQDASYQQLQVNSLNNHFPKANVNSDPTQNKKTDQISRHEPFYSQSLVNFWNNRFPNFGLNLLSSQNKQHEGVANTTTTTTTTTTTSNTINTTQSIEASSTMETTSTTTHQSPSSINSIHSIFIKKEKAWLEEEGQKQPILKLDLNELGQVVKILRGQSDDRRFSCSVLVNKIIDYFSTGKIPTEAVPVDESITGLVTDVTFDRYPKRIKNESIEDDPMTLESDSNSNKRKAPESESNMTSKSDSNKRQKQKSILECNASVVVRTTPLGSSIPCDQIPCYRENDQGFVLEKNVYNVDYSTQKVANYLELNQKLQNEARNNNGVSFGFINLSKCGRYLKSERIHTIVYYAIPDQVFYIDAQGWNGKEQKGQFVFNNMTDFCEFADNVEKITANTWGNYLFYSPVGPRFIPEKMISTTMSNKN